MPTHADQINSRAEEFLEVLRETLCRIDVKKGGMIPEHSCDGRDGLNHARLVIHMHDRDEKGVVPHGSEDVLRVDPAAGAPRETGDLESPSLEGVERLEDSLVLELCGHDVAPIGPSPFRLEPQKREVVALRSA